MLSLGSSHRYYLYRAATDMRKGFDGLSGLVVNELGRDPLSGEVFVFVNRKGDRMKLLVWERGGFVLWYKRLEAGSFELPGSDSQTYQLRYEELVLLLEGIVLESVRRRKRFSKKEGKKL